MGNGAAKFEAAEIGSAKPLPKEKCLGSPTGKGVTTLEVVPKGGMSSDIEVKMDGTLLYSTRMDSMMQKEGSVLDAAGALVAVGKYKTGFGKGTTRVLTTTAAFKGQESKDTPIKDKETALYHFATIAYEMKMKADEATYSLVTADGMELVYKAFKLNGMTFRVIIQDASEAVVAKVCATSKWNKKFIVEMAAGVDPVAIVQLASATLGGGNSSAGALAGAGVI